MMKRVLGYLARKILGEEDAEVLLGEMTELHRHRVDLEGKEEADRWLGREEKRAIGKLLAAAGEGLKHSRPWSPRKPQPGPITNKRSKEEHMYSLIRGLHSSIKGLARAPLFALTMIGTLALGIGGITAAFSVVHGVMLQPLPYDEPAELVRISNQARGQSWVFSAADYLALEEQQTQFERVAAMDRNRFTFASDEASERMLVHSVTPGFLPLLNLQPALGRGFTEEEGEPGTPPVALISWGFWNREFGGDPAAVGQSIRLDGAQVPVVGVLPEATGPLLEDAEILLPLALEPPTRKGPFFLGVVGRLAENVAPSTATAELQSISERIFPIWQDSWPDQESTWALVGLKDDVVGDVGTSLLVLLGATIFVLVMVCANGASLLLARLVDRRREFAVRTALGASKGDLIGHLLSESVTLTVLGAGVGLFVAWLGIRLATTVGASFLPRTNEMGFTPPVILFFAATTLVSLVLFGLLPALRGSGAEVADGLREGGTRSSPGTWNRRTRNVLVATQFAVSVPVLIGGGLLIASFSRLAGVDPGFDTEQVLAMDVSLPEDDSGSEEELSVFWSALLENLRALPGVAEAGVGRGRPPSDVPFTNNFVMEDQPVASGETQPSVPWVFASPEYLEALGTQLLAGRMFDATQDDDLTVVLVDQAFALRFYATASDAIGRRFRSGGCTGDGCPWTTIIGVTEEVRYSGLKGTSPGVMFVNSTSNPSRASSLILRVEAGRDPLYLVPLVRDIIRQAHSEAAVSRVASGEDLLRANLRVPRYLATLVGSFGAISLLLAILGIYGVMAYFVQQHRRDIGVRLALGGEPIRVVGLVMRRGMTLVIVGIGAGLASAIVLTRFMGSLLYGIGPTDPLVVGCSVSGMLLVAILACGGPALQASRVPPREVLAED